MSIKVKTVRVTPEKAAQWLEKNMANRNVSQRTVERYAADMAAGKWQMNGEPIIFNDQALLDGQHRLSAVVHAGVPVDMLVVNGVSCEAFRTIDSGKARTFAHTLSALGHKNCNNIAGALSMFACYERGNPFQPDAGFTKAQLEEVLAKNKRIIESVKAAVAVRTSIVTPTVLGFCHYVFSKHDREAADKFIRDISTGDGVKASSQVGLLRTRLVDESAHGRRLDRRLVVYLIFRTWSAIRAGERLQKLQIPRSYVDGGRVSVDLPKVS